MRRRKRKAGPSKGRPASNRMGNSRSQYQQSPMDDDDSPPEKKRMSSKETETSQGPTTRSKTKARNCEWFPRSCIGICSTSSGNKGGNEDEDADEPMIIKAVPEQNEQEKDESTKLEMADDDEDVIKSEDNADLDDEPKEAIKSEDSTEDHENPEQTNVKLIYVEPKKTDGIKEPEKTSITGELRDETTEKQDLSDDRAAQRDADEGQEKKDKEKPPEVSDKKDETQDVTDGNISTEAVKETERKRDGSKIVDDSKPEKQDDVENKVIDAQALEEKEKSDAEKLPKAGEDRDDTEDTSAGRDMDKMGETQGKDDSMVPSDSQPEKPNDVESEIEGITTDEKSSADTSRDEGQELKIEQNRQDQDISKSTDEEKVMVITTKAIKSAESEQGGQRTEVQSKGDDEEQGDKTDKIKSEEPREDNSVNVPSSQDTLVYNVLDESSRSGNESDNEKVDPVKPQDSDNRDNSQSDAATTSNFQPGDVPTNDEPDHVSSTGSTDSYNTPGDEDDDDDDEDVPTTSTSRWQQWWPDSNKKGSKPRLKTEWSDRDTKEYRSGYPGKKDNDSMKDNLLFYKNAIESEPRGDLIDNIHEYWWGDYDKLERHHGYIQWIFPIREKGMNYQSQELQLHEAKGIKSDKQAWARVLKSYEMMLDFYGMKLVDKEKGTIQRAANWKERYSHLNRSTHNYLRITRILKSLGELGYEQLKTPFVEFVLTEALENGQLKNCVNSCVQYWLHTIKSSKDRKRLTKYFDSHYDFS